MRNEVKRLRCAIYTRVSTEHGLEQDFNSLDAQREAAEAYIKSQAHEGGTPIETAYDDGGFSGAKRLRRKATTSTCTHSSSCYVRTGLRRSRTGLCFLRRETVSRRRRRAALRRGNPRRRAARDA